MKQILIFACGLIWVSACNVPAYAAAAVKVHVAVGKVSEVVLPEKAAKIIKGGEADSVLVEVLDNSVYLLPKSNAPADVFVTCVSGESYPLNLVIAPQHDVRVQVNGPSVRSFSGEPKTNMMDLMKELLLGREPAGATVSKEGQAMIFDNGQIELTLDIMYDFPHLTAYILKAQNLIDNGVIVPLQQMSFLNLLAVASDRDMLNPKGQEGDMTKIYVITGK